MVVIRIILLLMIISCTKLFSQETDSSKNTINKNRLSVNVNFIYNLCTNKKTNTWVIPNGKIANDNTEDSVYYLTFRNIDTKTFSVNLFYNKAFSKNLSFSFGLGFSQRKNFTKYDVYIDNNINKPNKLNESYTSNSLIIPLKMNYYINRFYFSVGNNIGLYYFNSDVVNYENGFKRSYQSKGMLSYMTHIESISYQVFKNKFFFINVTAEQAPYFYRKSGYNNWFMLGASYLF